jgi:hypothetical protein
MVSRINTQTLTETQDPNTRTLRLRGAATETDRALDRLFDGQRMVRLRLGTPAEEEARDLFPVYPDQDLIEEFIEVGDEVPTFNEPPPVYTRGRPPSYEGLPPAYEMPPAYTQFFQNAGGFMDTLLQPRERPRTRTAPPPVPPVPPPPSPPDEPFLPSGGRGRGTGARTGAGGGRGNQRGRRAATATAAAEGGGEPDPTLQLLAYQIKKDKALLKLRQEQEKRLRVGNVDTMNNYRNSRDIRIVKQDILREELKEGGRNSQARRMNTLHQIAKQATAEQKLTNIRPRGEAMILPMNRFSFDMMTGQA